MTLLREKVEQAIAILQEKEIDTWLTFVRETSAVEDPVLQYIYGSSLTWTSALILTRTGRRIAIVGRHEADKTKQTGVYEEVISYDQTIRDDLLKVLDTLAPRKIAINASLHDPSADGLTHGMHQLLTGYLEGTTHAGKLVSAETIISSLRGRKTSLEVKQIRKAIETTEEIFRRTFQYIHPGLTEIELADFMHLQMNDLGVTEAWDYDSCPIINFGPESPVGHVSPSDIRLQRGHLVHIDFGIRQDGYCSDLQRMIYLLRPGEKSAPAEVRKGFDTVVQAIRETNLALRVGMMGMEADAVGREMLISAGYPEYQYATGHQLGRNAHDGGAILGPNWERYGKSPQMLVEEGQVYTLEPGLPIPGYGYIGVEENVLMKASGSTPLSQFQKELILI